jgi:hypothetical protein
VAGDSGAAASERQATAPINAALYVMARPFGKKPAQPTIGWALGHHPTPDRNETQLYRSINSRRRGITQEWLFSGDFLSV